MTALENLTAGASVRALLASGVATVESVQWIGEQAVKDHRRHSGSADVNRSFVVLD